MSGFKLIKVRVKNAQRHFYVLPQPPVSEQTIENALANLAEELLRLKIPQGTILPEDEIHDLISQPSHIDFCTP